MMARIRFTRGTAVGGVGNDAAPGEVRDLPDRLAAVFVLQGRAVYVAAQAAEPEPVAAAAPSAEQAPAKKRRK